MAIEPTVTQSRDLQAERARVVEKHGPWTDHNILLADGLYTINENTRTEKLRRIVQVVADLSGKPLSQIRVLDLACLEGQYAIEFARQGAKAVGIEGREASVEKARFARHALNLDNVEFFQDDIRNLSKEKYGTFDVVLCLGVLYHLDAPDVFRLVEQIYEVCTHFAVFDTHFSVVNQKRWMYKGQEFCGRSVVEHDPESSKDERLEDLWASIDNLNAVWPTFNSLLNVLNFVGFTSVYQCFVPVEMAKPGDRVTLVGMKKERHPVLSTPKLNEDPWPLLPEGFEPELSMQQQGLYDLSHRINFLFPRKLRRSVKSILRATGLWRRTPESWERPWKSRHAKE